MPEFGRRQYHAAGHLRGADTPDWTKWPVPSVVAVALIAASVLGYRFLYHPAIRDPLLQKHESFEELVNRHASDEEIFRQYPSVDTRLIPIAFGNKLYKIPRNYLVELDRPDTDPTENTRFEIHVLLPDLAPRTAGNAGRFLQSPYYGGQGDQLDATIRGWQKELDLFARRVEWDRTCADKGAGVFRAVESGYRLCEAAKHELYLKDTPEGPLVFACDSSTDKNPGCTIAEPTGAGWGVLTLEFSRKYLYQADEIRKRFRSLLDSFAQK